MAGALARGLLLVIDYGYGRGAAPPQGTLLAYRHHRTHTHYLDAPGLEDLTAHVDFSLLEEQAQALGLAVVGHTTQDRFLIANGILEAFRCETHEAWHDARRVKARLQALQLIHPEGMGRAFRVLALAKGEGFSAPLAGLADPFDRSR
jgi:SAM-dependent MidA family methyltransferase